MVSRIEIEVPAQLGVMPNTELLGSVLMGHRNDDLPVVLQIVFEDNTSIVIKGKHNIGHLHKNTKWDIGWLWGNKTDTPILAAMPNRIETVGDIMLLTFEELHEEFMQMPRLVTTSVDDLARHGQRSWGFVGDVISALETVGLGLRIPRPATSPSSDETEVMTFRIQ